MIVSPIQTMARGSSAGDYAVNPMITSNTEFRNFNPEMRLKLSPTLRREYSGYFTPVGEMRTMMP